MSYFKKKLQSGGSLEPIGIQSTQATTPNTQISMPNTKTKVYGDDGMYIEVDLKDLDTATRNDILSYGNNPSPYFYKLSDLATAQDKQSNPSFYDREDPYAYRPKKDEGTEVDKSVQGEKLDRFINKNPNNALSKYVGELISRRLVPDDKIPELLDLMQFQNDGSYSSDPTYPTNKDTFSYNMDSVDLPQRSKYDEEKLQQLGGMWGKSAGVDAVNKTVGLPADQESKMMADFKPNEQDTVKASKKVKEYSKKASKKEKGGKMKVYAEGGKLAPESVQSFWNSKSDYTKQNINSFKLNGKTFTVK